ncbi:MAG: immunity 7 family protein [Lachnospiraceae bacterium]|nr:immunity 7 family protein [Lachnospiraceae bacterium]
MIELHGWITIREHYQATETEEENIHIVVSHIKEELNKQLWFHPQIKVLNGEYYMEFTLFANHKNCEVGEIFQLYKTIGQVAKGSYGLIYLHDDEDNSGRQNEFQVFVLAKGEVKQCNDPFLSPFIPVVEDEWIY